MKSSYGDQDGINAVIAGNWGELDPRWNVQLYISIDRTLRLIEDSPHKQRLIRDRWRLIRDAYIWHYVGSRKPWARWVCIAGPVGMAEDSYGIADGSEPGEFNRPTHFGNSAATGLSEEIYRGVVDTISRPD